MPAVVALLFGVAEPLAFSACFTIPVTTCVAARVTVPLTKSISTSATVTTFIS